MSAKIQLRRDTLSNWELINPIISDGEVVLIKDGTGTTAMRIGDGVSTIIASPVIGITQHNWKLADNSIQLITLTELEEAHALAIQAKGAVILG